jgi:hypothetical protein
MGKVAGDRRREWWPVAREGAAVVWARRRWGITAERARQRRERDGGDGAAAAAV